MFASTTRIAALGSVAILAMAVPNAAAAQQLAFNIPAQPAASGVSVLARQAGVQILLPGRLARGVRTQAVSGTMSVEAALSQMLAGTGLTGKLTGPRTYTIVRQDAAPQPASDDKGPEEGDPITVTGTRIRGSQSSSPVVTVSREEMKERGHNTLGEAMRALPQNFAGGQNPEVGFFATRGGTENQNNTGASAINLRGLGPSSTLTLLNGARLPFDGVFQATDVAPFPAAAIERIEILLDGASAVYGADAIGGVANVVLRRDYNGLEVSGRYGFATQGGYGQQEYTAVGGKAWGSGGFIVTGNYNEINPIRASDRSYLKAIPDQTSTVFPYNEQKGVLFSGHQSIGKLEFALDAFYSKRTQDLIYVNGPRYVDHRETDSWGLSPSLTLDTAFGWTAKLSGFYGSSNSWWDIDNYTAGTTTLIGSSRSSRWNKAASATLEGEGPLFALPGGDARAAVGIGYRHISLDSITFTSAGTDIRASRNSKSAFGEISLPLVGPQNEIPFLSRLMIDGAVRYEDYSDFGSIAVPKLGAVLSPVKGFDLRASWGKSFKTPNLNDQFFPVLAVLLPGSTYPGVPLPGNVLAVSGGNPNLTAERAETISAGVKLAPPPIPGLSVELNWFRIDYRQRVRTPTSASGIDIFTLPAFAPYAIRNPTPAQLTAAFTDYGLPVGQLFRNTTGGPYDPATTTGLLLGSYTNAAKQIATGMDASVAYSFDLGGGRMGLNATASWIDGTTRFNDQTAETPTTGITFYPANFKARAGASWSNGAFMASANVSHVDGTFNTYFPNDPVSKGFNTVDLVLGYTVKEGPLGGLELRAAATNLFDADPPTIRTLSPLQYPYDTTNATSLGRVMNFTVTKRF